VYFGHIFGCLAFIEHLFQNYFGYFLVFFFFFSSIKSIVSFKILYETTSFYIYIGKQFVVGNRNCLSLKLVTALSQAASNY
jgi:hypothetical protein